MANPKPTNPIKPGERRAAGKQRQLKDRFFDYVGDLPKGVYPWEIIQSAITADDCKPKEKIQGAAILGNWIMKESEVNIEVNANTVVIDDVESRIQEMLKTQEELDQEAEDQESAGSTTEYEEEDE